VHHVKINNPILIKRFSLFCMFVKDYNFFLFGFDCIYSFKITISFYLALTVFIVLNPLIVWSWCSCLFCFYWLVNSVQHQSVIALLAIPFSWLIPTLACRLNLENVNLVALLNQDNVKVNFFTSYLMHAYIYIYITVLFDLSWKKIWMCSFILFQVILDKSTCLFRYIILATLVNWSECWACYVWSA
jgi:hypothetical protein